MLSHLEMERFIHATAKRADLQVIWEDGEDATPRTNGKKVWLPRMGAGITKDKYQQLQHFVAHEVDHVNYSDMELLDRTGLDCRTSLLGGLWNLIEDQRIEYLGGQEYEGDRLCGNDVHSILVANVLKGAEGAPPEAVDAILPAFAWDNLSHADFYPSAHGVQDGLEERLSPEARATYEKLKGADYSSVLRNIRQIQDKHKGTQATLDLASRIFEEVYGGDAKKEIERSQQLRKEEAKGKGKGDGKGEGKKGEGEGDEGGDKESKDKKKREAFASVDYSSMMKDAHSAGVAHAGLHINYDNHVESANFIPAGADDYWVKHYAAGDKGGGGYYDSHINAALADASTGFSHRVRTILQIRAKDNYSYGKKRGKLHNSALHRVLMTEAPGYNERVFKQKQVNNVLDAAVTLLVDQSGSMGGDKFSHAAAAAVMLNDVIANTLHIPTEIVSFSTGHAAGPALYVHREHKDKLLPRDHLVGRLSSAASSGMSGNGDGDSVMWAFDRLRQRRERRKLLVVFSDGQPTDGNGDPVWYLRKVVQDIEQGSDVSIVGIGIQDHNVKKYYKEHHVINHTAQLEAALLNVIEGKLK